MNQAVSGCLRKKIMSQSNTFNLINLCVSVHKPQLFKIRYSMLLFVKKPQLCALSDGQAVSLNLALPILKNWVSWAAFLYQ